MAEKLNITFVKGSHESVFDLEWNYEVHRGQIMVNGEGPFYWMSKSKTFHLEPVVVKQIRRLVRKSRRRVRP